jgi:hypothetical protein
VHMFDTCPVTTRIMVTLPTMVTGEVKLSA